MISPRIARELRGEGLDVEAIKGDRSDLESLPDLEIVHRLAVERRVVVTNDVLDFQLIHSRIAAAGEEHSGMLFTNDTTMPRNKAAILLWVETLKAVLAANPGDDALRNRVRHLP